MDLLTRTEVCGVGISQDEVVEAVLRPRWFVEDRICGGKDDVKELRTWGVLLRRL